MQLSTSVVIDAPKEKVWQVVTDFDNATERISAIEKIEVLHQPDDGLLGFKWRETRTMFGKTATEVMEITEIEDNSHYMTYAENHGAIYESGISVAENGGKTTLTMTFSGKAQTFGAKLMSALMGWMFKGSMRKAVHQDLEDIKAAVEAS